MSQKLAKYISDPVVTVSIQEIKGNKVYVIGQVNKPGEFIMNPTVDVMQALSMAGGTTPFAALGDITVLRRTPTGKQSCHSATTTSSGASGSTRTSTCRAATWWSCREACNERCRLIAKSRHEHRVSASRRRAGHASPACARRLGIESHASRPAICSTTTTG